MTETSTDIYRTQHVVRGKLPPWKTKNQIFTNKRLYWHVKFLYMSQSQFFPMVGSLETGHQENYLRVCGNTEQREGNNSSFYASINKYVCVL